MEVLTMECDQRACITCGIVKNMFKDFYICKKSYRRECKVCFIKKNVQYQQKVKYWKKRFIDREKTISYSYEYYQNHKEKFKEYRKTFIDKHPGYYKQYHQNRAQAIKNKKNPHGIDHVDH